MVIIDSLCFNPFHMLFIYGTNIRKKTYQVVGDSVGGDMVVVICCCHVVVVVFCCIRAAVRATADGRAGLAGNPKRKG